MASTFIPLPAYVPRDTFIQAEDGRLMATVTDKNEVKIEAPFTAEQVIIAIIKYSQQMSTFQYERHQQEVKACLDGWKESIDNISEPLKTI